MELQLRCARNESLFTLMHFMKKLSLLLALLFSFTFSARAQTTTFSYQGRLNDSAGLANGVYDFKFTLWNAPSGIGQVGVEQPHPAVNVTNGTFTVTLDFGSAAFDGGDRWLEIAVRTNGAPAFNTLSPRRPITSAPYAIRAATAGSANSVPASGISGTIPDTQLSPNVARLNGSPTFTGTVTASGFTGNGAGITNISGNLPTQTILGTSVMAQPNMSYFANDSTRVSVTLPTNAQVGDIVRVTGLGAGGWQVQGAPGQRVNQPIGLNFVGGPDKYWASVASSADGNKLVAADGGGFIYTSTDRGTNWTAQASGEQNWSSVTSSADGTKLAAAPYFSQIVTSTDGGITWTARETSRQWVSIASSADGQKLVAAEFNGYLYTSSDAGVTWVQRASPQSWKAVASSANGTKLVAAVNDGQIHTSTDGGETWVEQNSGLNLWSTVASSSDGNRLVAGTYGGEVYNSVDGGVSWSLIRQAGVTSVACSSDGLIIAIATYNGIQFSGDAGSNWEVPQAGGGFLYGIALSADGLRIVAVPYGGRIYTFAPVPVTGGQGSLVELQYTGGGVWQRLISGVSGSLPNSVVARDANGDTAVRQLTWGTGSYLAPNGTIELGDSLAPGLTPYIDFHLGVGFDQDYNVRLLNDGDHHLIVDADVKVTGTLDGQLTGTFSGASSGTFSGASSGTFSGVSSGTFSGDGAGITNISGNLPTQNASGPLVLARPNMTYFVSDSSPSTVELPSNASVGDLVRLMGVGTGTWQVEGSSGQIISQPLGLNWVGHGPGRFWGAVASSTNATSLVAADSVGPIYTSKDSGATWTVQNSGDQNWSSVASSADGLKLAAAPHFGQIKTSSDGGISWVARESNRDWVSIASSRNGQILVAAADDDYLFTSTDAGITWTQRASSQRWRAVASSADGTRLFGAANAQVYTSSDSGATWTLQYSGPRTWISLACSADGSRLVAGAFEATGYTLYTSADRGSSWSFQLQVPLVRSVSCSSDGMIMAAATSNGIYFSQDAGSTWAAREEGLNWTGIAMSADGYKLVAANGNGQIHVSAPAPVSGAQGSLVELQYSGGGKWQRLNSGDTASTPNSLVARDVNGDVNVKGLNWGGVSQLAANGTIELGNSLTPGFTPFIDFHFSTGTSPDYSVRLINDADHHLSIDANVSITGDATVAGTLSGNGAGLLNLSPSAVNGVFSPAQIPSLDASKITSGKISDVRLSTNVALLNANQTFSGVNSLTNVSNTFAGDGSHLSNLSAAAVIGVFAPLQIPNLDVSKITTGTLADSRLSANVPLLNGSPNFTGTVTASAFSGNGAALNSLSPAAITGTFVAAQIPNLDASKIASGTLADSRLSANVPLLTGSPNFTGIVTAPRFVGDGSTVSNLDASKIASGTLSSARLPASVITNNQPASVTLNGTFAGAFNGTHTGDGSGLTSISSIQTGISINNPNIIDGQFYNSSFFLGSVRMPSLNWGYSDYKSSLNPDGSMELGNSTNVATAPYLDFHYGTGTEQDYNVRLINDQSGRLKLEGNLLVNGTVSMGSANPITFKDANHGIGQAGSVAAFNGLGAPDGPIVWGYDGGALGSLNPGAKLGLVWTSTGRIGIGTTSPATALHVSATGDAEISVQSKDPNAHRWTLQSGGDNVNPNLSGSFDIIDRTLGIGRMHFTATGNVGIGTGTPSSKLEVVGEAKATVFTPTSDRNAKENFTAIAPSEVLAKVLAMPITQWNFKELPGSTHIGPMAQDFRAAFGTGADDRHISTVDADGVALAAIQGLNQKLESQKTELEEKKTQIESLEKRLEALEKLLGNRVNNP